MTETRYAHVHAGCILHDKSGVARTGKGRLVATIATSELPDGTLAVGVSRVAGGDNPVRHTGRQRAHARMERVRNAYMNRSGMKATQVELLDDEVFEMLAFRMERDTFVKHVIQGSFYRTLSTIDDHRVASEHIEALRNMTLPV